MILSLPIYFHTDETRIAKETGMSYSIAKCKYRDMVFYAINAIGAYWEDDKEYCEIHCNGSIFISPLTKTEVAEKIVNAQTYYAN